jgi:hypothetical protein
MDTSCQMTDLFLPSARTSRHRDIEGSWNLRTLSLPLILRLVPPRDIAAPVASFASHRQPVNALGLTGRARSVVFKFIMKLLILVLWVVWAGDILNAQTNVWQPSPGHVQVPIWPGAAPDARPMTWPEVAKTVTKPLVGGKQWVLVD